MRQLLILFALVGLFATEAHARLIRDARYAFGTVLSGQTSVAISIPGLTTGSRCQATQSNVATNSVYVRAAVATRDTVTVTLSGDPGASNQGVSIWCAN